MASHAGTTPMDRRRDAAAAVAELDRSSSRSARRRTATRSPPSACSKCPTARSTWCRAAASSAWTCARPTTRSATRCVGRRAGRAGSASASAAACATRSRRRMRAAAAPSAPEWQQRWEKAVDALGVPLFRMPSGAGHDAMKLHEVMPQAMLFVRGLNSGISHNPLESSTNDDMRAGGAKPSSTCWTTSPQSKPHDRLQQARRLDRRPLRRGSAFLQQLVRVPTDTPPGNNAPHAERTAELLKDFGFEAEKHAVPEQEVKDYGLESITNLIVRRKYGTRPDDRAERARRRGAARRRLDARPVRRRDRRRQALRPRRRGQQERLRDLHLRAARARGAAKPARRAASSCTSPTTRSSAASSARAGC